MNIILVHVDETHTIAVQDRPTRVWTAIPPSIQPVVLPKKLVHYENAFIEDYGHDWSWKNGVLKYFSRCVENDEPAWVYLCYDEGEIAVVDFKSPTANMYGCEPCPRCKSKFRVSYKESGMVKCDECGLQQPYTFANKEEYSE